MTEGIAFGVFVILFMGALAALTLGMVAVALILLRNNRTGTTTKSHSSPK